MASNLIPLDKDTVKRFRTFFDKQKTHVAESCRLAAQIRNEHLHAATGSSNAKYDAEFTKWWKAHELNDLFGTLSNFTKYAAAGDFLDRVHAQFKQKEHDQLPLTVGALYALSQLTNTQLTLCFEGTYSRKNVLADPSEWKNIKSKKALINPSTSESAITSWSKKWSNPPQPRTTKLTIKLLEIYIHGSIYDLDNQGLSSGKLKSEQIEEYVEKVNNLFTGTADLVRIDSKLQNILDHIKRQKENHGKKKTKKKKNI